MRPPRRFINWQTFAMCAATALLCASLVTAAAVVPAPPVMLAIIVAVSVVLPMVAAWQSAVTPVGLRFSPVDEALALRTLRRELDELPETHHPLGL